MAEEEKEKSSEANEHHSTTKILLIVLGVVLILGCLASVGMMATFGHGRNFTRNDNNIELRSGGMMGRRGGMMGAKAYGSRISGTVTSISGNSIVVKATNDTSYTVTVNDATSYSKNDTIAKQSDLVTNDNIIVIGPSNSQGGINATAIIIK